MVVAQKKRVVHGYGLIDFKLSQSVEIAKQK